MSPMAVEVRVLAEADILSGGRFKLGAGVD